MSCSRIFVLVSPKGGVGKSTIAANLAASFSQMRKKTLLVELDNQLALQHHYSSYMNASFSNDSISNMDVRVVRESHTDTPHAPKTIDIISIPQSSALLETLGLQDGAAESAYSKAAVDIEQYDIAIVDTKTGSDDWARYTANPKCTFIICLNPEAASFTSLRNTLQKIQDLQNENRSVTYKFLINKMDSAVTLYSDTYRVMCDILDDEMLESTIPDDPAFSESFAKGKPIFAYSPYSKGNNSIEELANTLIS